MIMNDIFEIAEILAEDRKLPLEKVIEAIKVAVSSAYRKEYGSEEQEIRVELNAKDKTFDVFVQKKVVQSVEDPKTEISLLMARVIKENPRVGEIIDVNETPKEYGRIASQSAMGALKEALLKAERQNIAMFYQDKIGRVFTGVVRETSRKGVILDFDKSQGILPYQNQVPGERYYNGQRLKVLLKEIDTQASGYGEQLVVSRADPEFIYELFRIEVPEIEEESVRIVDVARIPGTRSKVAIESMVEGIDAMGTFIGPRGVRVRLVQDELSNEKIELIQYSDDIEQYIKNSLSPAQVEDIEFVSEAEADIRVPYDQIAIAIGRSRQNVRLASQLTGVSLNVVNPDEQNEQPETAGTESIADEDTNLQRFLERTDPRFNKHQNTGEYLTDEEEQREED